jgi:hypothetical protein
VLLIIALSVVVLIAALLGLFITSAHLIRRDIDDRYDRIRVRIEEDARAVLRDLLNEHRRT